MTNSYCGKNCTFCVSKKEGKCIGCKPEVHVPLHSSIYIAGVNNTAPGGLLTDDSQHSDSENDTPKEIGVRFSSYCQIAICCRKGKMEGCNECLKTYTCEKYAKKGIMNVIVDSKMESWGMIDHGLKNAVPFLYVLLGCFLIESFFTVFSWAPYISTLFFFLSVAVAGVRAYAFYKLRTFNTNFLTVAVLTIVYIFSVLFNKLLTVIDYGVIGTLLLLAGAIVELASSILCYKITFDAYAELVSPVDFVLEKRWLKIWKLTIIIYIIAVVVSLLTLDKTGVSGFVLYFSAATLVLNIITFILMIKTIDACKND